MLKKYLSVIQLLIFIGFITIISSCDHTLNSVNDYPGGSYHYHSYNTDGKKVVEGWFTIETDSSGIVTGEWHFDPVGHPKNIGPQVGDGELIGGLQGDTLWLELNPQFVDNNLGLVGKINGNIYSGKWYWVSFPGVTGEGTFTAIYNQ